MRVLGTVFMFGLLLWPAVGRAAGPEPGKLQRILWGEVAPEEMGGVAEPEQHATDDGGPPVEPPVPIDEAESKGSVSLGYPAAGRLEGGVPFPEKGVGFRFLGVVRERGTAWGTEELRGLIERVGLALDAAHPGSEMRLGNVGKRGGGRIRWSVSHRCGRDVDILFLADDGRGRPLRVDDFEHYDRSGRSRTDRARRFSTARNWTVVRALVMDSPVRVQRIFVAEWLRRMLLAHGRTVPGDEEAVRRAEDVLSQPRYALDHSDHFHVRIYCSREDTLLGCHDYDPRWEWVEDYSRDVAARVRELVAELRSEKDTARLAALDLLRRLEARGAAVAVSALLTDTNVEVRRKALSTLASFGRKALDRISKVLPAVRDADWAALLVQHLGDSYQSGHTPLLERLARSPQRVLEKADAGPGLVAVRAAAARALGRVGRKSSAEALYEALGQADPALRVAADEALSYLTNHRHAGRWDERASKKQLRRQKRTWRRWLDRHRDNSRAQWVRLGFKKKGIRFRGKMVSRQAAPRLIRALDLGGHLAHNAYRTLLEIFGDDAPAYCGIQRDCWKKWWERR